MHRPAWILAFALATGCAPTGAGPVAAPAEEARQTAAKPAPSARPSAPAPQVSVAPGGVPALEPGATKAAGIIGKLKTPEGLTAEPAFGLLALAQGGVAGAAVTLVDAAGAPVSAETATTDAEGNFAFAAQPAGDRPFFVQARFTLAGRPLVLTAPAEPAADLAVDVDPASTLVAARFARLLADGTLPARPGVLAKLQALEAAVRGALADAGSLPYLGEGATDLVAAFDQLALDDPQVAAIAAKLTDRAARPADAWTVTTIAPEGADPASGEDAAAGVFALDAQGRVHVATASTPVRILRLDDQGIGTEVAQLPPDLLPPASLAFGPDGALHAAALDATRATWLCKGTAGVLPKVAGGPFFKTRAAAGLGRIVVDGRGLVYAAAPKAHVILSLEVGQKLPRIVAGGLGEAGHQDGPADAARFRQPNGLALGPDGALWVADTNNACIRRIAPGADAQVTTVVGRPGEAFYRSGRGAFARIGRPTSVAAGADGTLYLTDAGTARVRRVSKQGSVFLVAGSGQAGAADGPGPQARFMRPGHLAVAPDGAVWVHDLDGAAVKLRRIAPDLKP